jgi:hypothetical protein
MANNSLRNTERSLIANIAMYLNGYSINPTEFEKESGKVLSTYTPYIFLQSNKNILSEFNVKTAYTTHGDTIKVSFENSDKNIEVEFNKTSNTINCRYG